MGWIENSVSGPPEGYLSPLPVFEIMLSTINNRSSSTPRRGVWVLIVSFLLGGAASQGFAADIFKWDTKKNLVTANFRDWSLERALTNIEQATRWNVKIPEDSGITVSGTFRDLPPKEALNRMFGHLNYAVFSSPKGGKPRLQIFLINPEIAEKAAANAAKSKASKPTTTRKNPFSQSTGKKPNYADVMKRFDTNGDGLISTAERERAREMLVNERM